MHGTLGVVVNLTSGSGVVRWIQANGTAVSPSTTYTVSCKVKSNNFSGMSGNFFYIRQYVSNGGAQIAEYGIFSNAYKTKISDDEWYLAYNSFTTASNCTWLTVEALEYTAGCMIWCYDLQLEAGTFAKAKVLGSVSEARLFLPISHALSNTTCTINFDYFKEYGVSNTLISNNLTGGTPPNGKWWGLYHDSSGGVYNHWLDGTQTSVILTQTQYSWVNYTIAWDTNYEYVYVNGVEKAKKAKSADLATNQLPTVSLGWGWAMGNGIFKNFKVYNRTLSVAEITQLANESFKLDNTRATTLQYIESPTIPADAYYYPLASDTKDISKTFDAYTNTNVAYEDESIWVGTSTTNVVTNTNLDTGWTKVYCTGINWENSSPNYAKSQVVSFYDNNVDKYGFWYSYGDYAPQVPNTTYTVSLGVKTVDSNFVIGFYTADNSELGRYNSELLNVPGGGNWKKVIWNSFLNPINSQSSSLSFVFNFGNNQGETQRTWLCAPQMEAKPFASPFVVGTRGATHLSYNFNSSIGLDWSGNWTICYWKKPIATHADTLAGYNIESIGANAGNGATYYAYWGKPNGGNTYHTHPATTTPAYGSYFNNWQFVCIRKNGGTMYFDMKGLDAGLTGASTTTVPTTATACVTSFGYDFKMGGWDNEYPTNTYYRDLIVVKRALTDTEMNNIYKQFRITKLSNNSPKLIEKGV